MCEQDLSALQRRVLVLAPTLKDADYCRTVLDEVQLSNTVCRDLTEICRNIEAGAAVAIIAEEALQPAAASMLLDVLEHQGPWSDFPILVLTWPGAGSQRALQVLETFGNVTLLERPVRVLTLISAVRTALRARERQYQIRDLLLQSSRTAERLREEAQRKDEFLAMLAHELRNPLAPIRNGVSILQLDLGDDPEKRDLLAMMDRQVGQMVRLVDDLLDVSRILRGKIGLQCEVLDLPTLIQQAAETAQSLIVTQQHELTFTFGPGPMHIDGDATRLAQVFANLLNNAAKYTDPGGRIRVDVQRTKDGMIATTVTDNGMGISAEMLTRVFDLFSQAERSLDRSQGGLGLGLTLVRRLVEMHGGCVEAYSPGLGHGSEFRVTLPSASQPETEPRLLSCHAPAPPATNRQRILVVDDNRDAADSLARLLLLAGHPVQTQYDGNAALDEMDRFKPDVVLLDIGLPGMNGYDVARCLRNRRRDLLLIAITGYGQEEDRRSAVAAGFDHHFVKPIDLKQLQETLNSSA